MSDILNVDILSIIIKYISHNDVRNLAIIDKQFAKIITEHPVLYNSIATKYYSYTCRYKSLRNVLQGYFTEGNFIDDVINKNLQMCYSKVTFKKTCGSSFYPESIIMLNYKVCDPGLKFVNMFIVFEYVDYVMRYKI